MNIVPQILDMKLVPLNVEYLQAYISPWMIYMFI